MMTQEFMTSAWLDSAAEAIKVTENAYRDLWNAVRPNPGETWTKEFCGNQMCRMGWSLGAGTYLVEDNGMDYGAPHHLVCGCLHKAAT